MGGGGRPFRLLKRERRLWQAYHSSPATLMAFWNFERRFGEAGVNAVLRHGLSEHEGQTAYEVIRKVGHNAATAIDEHGADALRAITRHPKHAERIALHIARHGPLAMKTINRAEATGMDIGLALKELSRQVYRQPHLKPR